MLPAEDLFEPYIVYLTKRKEAWLLSLSRHFCYTWLSREFHHCICYGIPSAYAPAMLHEVPNALLPVPATAVLPTAFQRPSIILSSPPLNYQRQWQIMMKHCPPLPYEESPHPQVRHRPMVADRSGVYRSEV